MQALGCHLWRVEETAWGLLTDSPLSAVFLELLVSSELCSQWQSGWAGG